MASLNLFPFSKENFSPSLDILESNEASSNKKLDSNHIRTNSDLLETVFSDFNIEVKVINNKKFTRKASLVNYVGHSECCAIISYSIKKEIN